MGKISWNIENVFFQGNDFEDAAISFLCPGCGLAQTTAEIDVKLL